MFRGALGTPAVLIALLIVVAAQLAFSYAPIMHGLFQTRPVDLVDGLVVIAAGILLMLASRPKSWSCAASACSAGGAAMSLDRELHPKNGG